MSFRRRITLVSAAAVAIAVVLASVLTYLLTSHQLHGQVDTQLRNRGATACASSTRGAARRARRDGSLLDLTSKARTPDQAAQRCAKATQRAAHGQRNLFGSLPPRPDQVRGYQQVVEAHGQDPVRSSRDVTLPVDARTRALAAGSGSALLPRRPRQRHPPARPRRARRHRAAPCSSPSR